MEARLQSMTLREKVGQLFYVRPELLDTDIQWTVNDDLVAISLQEITTKMRNLNKDYPVGGIVLYAHNIKNAAQLSRLISQIRTLNGQPLLWPMNAARPSAYISTAMVLT